MKLSKNLSNIFTFTVCFGIFILTCTAVFAESKTDKVQKPLDDFEVGRYQYCGKDSDCTIANNGCCDCANGGKDVAINKKRLEDFKARFSCNDVMCTEMAADPRCGSGLVSCINHKCKLFERSEAPDKGF